jgi:flavin reductase (DIM6/NTAB) family NADH-FMN oxidoreductase RutF
VPETILTPIDSRAFRRACGRFATGVTIVTLKDASGQPQGMTVNSFTSVSAQPPLVLVCVDFSSNMLPHFRASSHYAVNVLAGSQQELSNRFASRGVDRFDEVEFYEGVHGVPLLPGTLVQLECAIRNEVEAGDHALFIAEVVAIHNGDDTRPLLFFDSAYRTMA